MTKQTWTLEDAEDAHAESPNSFFIPPRAERESQKPGDLVRLHFLLRHRKPDDPRAERMWVEVTKVDAGHYQGVLTNTPLKIVDLDQGDIIEFEARHICRTIISPEHPRWVECIELKALVSAAVFEPPVTVRFMYREEPQKDQDSGWRLFAGTESDEFLETPSNIRICDVGWLIDMDPSLVEPLRGVYGSAFERETALSQWMRVEDFDPPED